MFHDVLDEALEELEQFSEIADCHHVFEHSRIKQLGSTTKALDFDIVGDYIDKIEFEFSPQPIHAHIYNDTHESWVHGRE